MRSEIKKTLTVNLMLDPGEIPYLAKLYRDSGEIMLAERMELHAGRWRSVVLRMDVRGIDRLREILEAETAGTSEVHDQWREALKKSIDPVLLAKTPFSDLTTSVCIVASKAGME